MDLKPIILISSIDHLETYEKIVKSASFREKFFYNYQIPPGFPMIKNQPSIYFSRGELTLEDDELIYGAFNEKSSSDKDSFYKNLQDDLSFTLNRSNIKSIEKYHFKRAFGRYNRHWIRITCIKDIMDGDFLIATDNIGNTTRLFKMLNQLKEGRNITVSLTDYSAKTFIKAAYLGVILLYIPLFLRIMFTLIPISEFGNLTGPLTDSIALSLFFILFILPYLLIFSFLCFLIIGSNEKIRQHSNRIVPLILIGLFINSLNMRY